MDHLERWHNTRSGVWHRWTNWVSLQTAVKKAPEEPGGYVLGIWLPETGASRTIHRLLGDDNHGVLDIGASVDLRRRIGELLRCVTTDDALGHMAGWRYRALELHKRLEGELRIAWRPGAEGIVVEAELMQHYLNSFGELPPLNYQFNWRGWIQ